VDGSIRGPEAFIQTNVLGTFRLLDAEAEKGPGSIKFCAKLQTCLDAPFTHHRAEAATMPIMVELTEPQAKSLSILAEHGHCSLNELVQEAVSDYLNRHRSVQEAHAAFGLWRQKYEDGLTYQERVRSEWSDESTV